MVRRKEQLWRCPSKGISFRGLTKLETFIWSALSSSPTCKLETSPVMLLSPARHTQRNVARFRLHSHSLRIESSRWQPHDHICDKCGMQVVQDEKHALFLCPCLQMCSLRLQFAELFTDFPGAHKIYINQTGAFYFSQACSENVFKIFQNQTCDSYRFISDIMDVFSMAGVHQQAEQPNYLAEGQTLL